MIKDNRIVFSDNGTLTDASVALSKIETGTLTLPWVALEDALYIGSTFPFNNRFISVSTANTSASVLSVELYNGSEWVAAVDLMDGTEITAGKTLSGSGVVTFQKDRSASWPKIGSTEDIAALSTLKIYNKYWARLKVSANLLVSTAIQYVGVSFANDAQLGLLYPDVVSSNMLTAFAAGKTNWNEQHVMAADMLIDDLQNLGAITSSNQIMTAEKFKIAAIHLVASIIYRAFGDDYKDQFAQAMKDYRDAVNLAIKDIDENMNATLDESESYKQFGVFRR